MSTRSGTVTFPPTHAPVQGDLSTASFASLTAFDIKAGVFKHVHKESVELQGFVPVKQESNATSNRLRSPPPFLGIESPQPHGPLEDSKSEYVFRIDVCRIYNAKPLPVPRLLALSITMFLYELSQQGQKHRHVSLTHNAKCKLKEKKKRTSCTLSI